MIEFFKKKKKDAENNNYNITQISTTESATNGALIITLSKDLEKEKEIHLKKRTIYNICAILSSIFLGSIGYGVIITLISFKLESKVGDEILIAISSVFLIAAGVFFAKYLNSFGEKLGLIKGTVLASLFAGFCCLLFYFYVGYFFWLVVTFAFGVASFILAVKKQVMIIEVAPEKIRGILIALSGMTGGIGNSLGPIVLKSVKTGESFLSFIIAFIFFTISLVPILKIKEMKTVVKKEKMISLWRYIKTSPKIMFSGFTFNYCFASICAFLIIYGIKIGLNKEDASILYSTFLFGTIFSIAIGYLTDILNRRLIMIFGAFSSLCLVIFLAINQDVTKLYLPLFLVFGSLVALRIPAIILINEKYKPTQRLAVNTAFIKMNAFGNMSGIIGTGFFMKFLGPQGLWFSMIFILNLFLIFCAYNYYCKFKNLKEIHI